MPSELLIHCNRCSGKTFHNLVHVFVQDMPNGEAVSWQIVRCAGCLLPSFYKEHSRENQDGWEVTESFEYPVRHYRSPLDFINAPANLDEIYTETIDAFNRGSYIFCAGGLRALVEGICADQNVHDGPKRDKTTGAFVQKKDGSGVVRDKNLECRIEGLVEHKVLYEKDARMLHQHRYLGNEALHEIKVPARSTLEAAIEMIEYIMQRLYTIQPRVDELERLRDSASST